MIKIGVVNIDCSHPLAFARELNNGDRARYYAVYNEGFRGEEEVKSFVEKQGLDRICHSIEELADCTDVGFIQGCNWDKHLEQALPFIDRGKPVFIDKPMVGNIAECRRLTELEKNGATVLGASSARYCFEVRDFLNISEETKGEVLHVDITVGVDEFNYAIHAIEALCAMVNKKPISVKYVGRGSQKGQTCDTYFVEFDGGATGCYHSVLGNYVNFNVTAITTVSSYCFTVDNTKLYKALLDEVCNKLEGKENRLANMEKITDSIKVALAGKCSKENDGITVDIESPLLEGVSFDGTAFEKTYAASSSPMYL